MEDEEPLRLATVKILRAKGFRVIETADGNEALAAISAHKDTIRVVLLDVALPGAPSREVLAEARRLLSNIKVVVSSAYGADMVADSFPGMEQSHPPRALGRGKFPILVAVRKEISC